MILPRSRLVLFVFLLICYSLLFLHLNEIQPSSTYPIFHSDDERIEKSLQNIPICTSFDRYRQRNLLHTLLAWTQFAEKSQIRYWIAYGTLIGYVRHRSLLPHHEDIDVMIFAQDTERLLSHSNRTFLSQYDLKVHPQWSIVDYRNRSYFLKDEIDFIAPNARFFHRLFRYHIDIWPIYESSINKGQTLIEYNRFYQWTSTPREWIFPLQSCQFSGIDVWCPAQTEQIVAKLYGKDALNQSDRECRNGTWRRTKSLVVY